MRTLNDKPVLVRELLKAAGARHGIPPRSILERGRELAKVEARADVIAGLSAAGWSLSRIGLLFTFHHETVRYHLARASDRNFRSQSVDGHGVC